jgi:hypothetical protein
MRRTRSFNEQLEQEELIRQVKARVEKEAQEMEEWVRQRPAGIGDGPSKLQDLAGLSIANTLNKAIDVERLPCQRELKEHVEFMQAPVFDESRAEAAVSFTNNGRTITYHGKSYSTTVVKTPKNRGLTTGRCGWILYIEKSRVQGWIQIGVIDEERFNGKCKTSWDGNPHPFRKGEIARRSNGNFHSGRSEAEATMVLESIYMGGYTSGDTIGMKVDFDDKEIQWTKNGEPYGKAVSFEGGPIWPSVSLDSPGESVSLLYYTCSIRSIHNHIRHSTVLTNNNNNNNDH